VSDGILRELKELVGVMKGIRKEIAQGFEALHCAMDKTWEEVDEESEESEDGGEELEANEVEELMDDLDNVQVENAESADPSALA
jgi:hypothetical protein